MTLGGFFHGSGGKLSMARLIAFILALDATMIGISTAVYVLSSKPSGEVIAAIAAVVGAFVAAGCVHVLDRGKGTGSTE